MAFGRFARSAGAQPMSDINVTPLVDVMLVLVVIFILAAPLLAGSLRLELPRVEGVTPGIGPAVLRIEIARSGELAVEGMPVDDAGLSARLKDVAGTRPSTEIQLRADAAVPYGRVAWLMGVAQSAGLNRIAFVAEPEPAPAPR